MRMSVGVLVASAVLLVAACGGGDGGGEGGGTQSPASTTKTSGSGAQCSGKLGTSSCAVCLEQGCCDESLACKNEPQCGTLLVCVNKCSDDACTAKCSAAYPSGVAPLRAVLACTSLRCASSCN
jgi:hypothetical protein